PRTALEAEQHAEAGFAEAHGVRQHGLEHWLQLAGRTRNYLQHLRRSCLLLQRLAQLALARFELLFQLVSVCLEVLLRPSLGLAAVPVERSLRPRVGLFAPLRDKVTSSAQLLVSFLGPVKDRAYQS